mmetsp:Transcript_9022/g.9903  ORF Transcript_9022/g.9903 Transcript_9022/m.9903 type:complete len:211 (-) Transcript_9022:52-684(-)
MKSINCIYAFAYVALSISPSDAFVIASSLSATERLGPLYSTSCSDSNRRSFINKSATLFSGLIATTSSILVSKPDVANALPLVTVAEFENILKDSAKSIAGVALSGPKLETAVVTLIDGTQFGLSDLYESSTDPRSPLKLISTCRLYKIPIKSGELEETVLKLSSSGSKKKRVYMNERVRVAAEKEKEKKLRMEQDEIERQVELDEYQSN